MIEVAFKFLFCPQVYRFFFPFARTNNFRFSSFSELKLGCFFSLRIICMPKWLQTFNQRLNCKDIVYSLSLTLPSIKSILMVVTVINFIF